ncbi:MAG: hypothetical protein JW795_22480 [Chitinivibrionales bacterium]|nr:hypothetical protein [Chitinivibrionales bacterium]
MINHTPLKRRNIIASQQGQSIIEVITASVILLISTLILTNFLHAGDRLYGRNRLIEYASVAAYNEIEHLKALSPLSQQIADTSYEEEVGGRLFFVSRTQIALSDTLDSLLYKSLPIELSISEVDSKEKPLLQLRLLQGYDTQK